MGILNLTPDSFSGDGRIAASKNDVGLTVATALRKINEGADMLDIGGESTRPGSRPISASEEIRRILPTLKKLKIKTRIPLSVDTYKPLVAKAALDAGASIINYIRGTQPDRQLIKMVQRYRAAIVLMHMRGTPKSMQHKIHYANLMDEIISELGKSAEFCLESGIESDRIILDPGIGFGKTVAHNLEILNRLPEIGRLNYPILVGTSRKSFIGKILDADVQQRLIGSVGTETAAILRGAHIVRVHDCVESSQAAKIADAILNFHNYSKL